MAQNQLTDSFSKHLLRDNHSFSDLEDKNSNISLISPQCYIGEMMLDANNKN